MCYSSQHPNACLHTFFYNSTTSPDSLRQRIFFPPEIILTSRPICFAMHLVLSSVQTKRLINWSDEARSLMEQKTQFCLPSNFLRFANSGWYNFSNTLPIANSVQFARSYAFIKDTVRARALHVEVPPVAIVELNQPNAFVTWYCSIQNSFCSLIFLRSLNERGIVFFAEATPFLAPTHRRRMLWAVRATLGGISMRTVYIHQH